MTTMNGSMKKLKSLAFRDMLNNLISTVGQATQEDQIIRCCLATAIEELEKWIYDEEWTPSVRSTDDIVLSDKIDPNTLTQLIELLKAGKLDNRKYTPEKEKIEYGPVNKLGLTAIEATTLMSGKRIAAIKEYRIRKDCGLREAKEFIDKIIEENPEYDVPPAKYHSLKNEYQ